MNNHILRKMVLIDGMEIKLMKLGEEITEVRFEFEKLKGVDVKRAYQDQTINPLLEEIAQVKFVSRQLEAYTGNSFKKYFEKMLKRYGFYDKYLVVDNRFKDDISKLEKIEFYKRVELLKSKGLELNL